MKVSFNWIQEFIKIDLPLEKQLEMLTDLGLEVEGNDPFESVKGSLKGVVVGEVLSCVPHPNADRLKVTKVNIGEEQAVQIVCGAPNVAAGQKVPVATIGTVLYTADGEAWTIKKGKIRGEASHGMICAEDELGLGTSHDGIMVLDESLSPGTPCASIFAIEKDNTIEIGLTPNRADAMSHMGVARDLKAACIQAGIPFEWNYPNNDSFRVDNNAAPVEVIVEDKERAPLYYGLTLSGLEVKPSPSWLQNRLKAIGLSPINNIVDATNYILHHLGQPLHAFDLDKVKGKIQVKTVPQDTPFVTLDGVERKLHTEDLMICDDHQPLCIAGVFGGQNSGVSQSTTRIFLESAYFNPVSIRKTAKRHGLNTDASFRFERGIDPEIGVFALKQAALLIKDIAGGEVTSHIQEATTPLPDEINLFLNFNRITKVLGQEIPKDELQNILNALEIRIQNVTEEGFSMVVPRYRVDVTREADIIEEILRVYGYNKIETTNTLKSVYPEFSLKSDYSTQQRIAQQLVGQGFYEIQNNSLTNPAYAALSEELDRIPKVSLLNPLGQDLSELRTGLLFSMLEVVAFNRNRQQKTLRLYEFGKAYQKTTTGFEETKKLGLCLNGAKHQESWNSPQQSFSFFDLKQYVNLILDRMDIEKYEIQNTGSDLFSEGFDYTIKDKVLVKFGSVKSEIAKHFSIDQEVLFAEFNWDILYDLSNRKDKIVTELPKFPTSRRDFALLIDKSVTFDALKQAAEKVERKILTKVDLFDVYEGKNIASNKKSYGLSFYFNDPNKTLTDKQIDKVMGKLRKTFESQFDAELR